MPCEEQALSRVLLSKRLAKSEGNRTLEADSLELRRAVFQ
jgi:hypothetical protein